MPHFPRKALSPPPDYHTESPHGSAKGGSSLMFVYVYVAKIMPIAISLFVFTCLKISMFIGRRRCIFLSILINMRSIELK